MSERTPLEVLELLRAEAARQGLPLPELGDVEPLPVGDVVHDLLIALERDGMRWVECAGCLRDFMTRRSSNYCPPCAGTARGDELTAIALAVWRARLLRLLCEVEQHEGLDRHGAGDGVAREALPAAADEIQPEPDQRRAP